MGDLPDAVANGRPTQLTPENRREIMRRLRVYGEPLREIGDLFGVSRQRVDQILQPEKQSARAMTKEAIARERLEVPGCCERCGSEDELEGHHEDYGRPLDVEFLCRECHRGAHGDEAHSPGRYIGRMKDVDPDTLGGRIRSRRIELRMTQAELAEAIGTHSPAVTNYEIGVTASPLASRLKEIARALCCSTDWLLFGDHQPSKNGGES